MAIMSPYSLDTMYPRFQPGGLNDPMVDGGLVPNLQTAVAPPTGGTMQPLPTALPPLAGPLPAVPPGGIATSPVSLAPSTGGYNPAMLQPLAPQAPQAPAPAPSLNLAGINGQQYVAQAFGNNQTAPGIPSTNVPTQNPNQAGQQVQGYLNDLLESGNPYITNAARRGLETAGSRGLLNSSIAAGASTRSAIEAAQPILSEIMGLNNARENMQFQGGENQAQRQLTALLDREGRAFQGEQAGLDRTQGVNNSLLGNELDLRNMQAQNFYDQKNTQQDYDFRRAMQSDSVAQQDWLSNQNFSREFNAGIAMLPIQNATQLHGAMMQAALEQPEVYTPEVLSGFSNFFNNQFLAQMQMYFPNKGGT